METSKTKHAANSRRSSLAPEYRIKYSINELVEIGWSLLTGLDMRDRAYVFQPATDKFGGVDGVALMNAVIPRAALFDSMRKIRTRGKLLRAARRAGARLRKKPNPRDIEHAKELAKAGVRLLRAGKHGIGTALLGYAYAYISPERLCLFCFRHATPKSRYCDIHRPVNNKKNTRAHYIAARRRWGKANNDIKEDGFWKKLLLQRTTEKEILAALGITSPQDPEGWEHWRKEMMAQYPWLPPSILNAVDSWDIFVCRLRERLQDRHCLSLNLQTWREKLRAADLERNQASDLQRRYDRRRSDLPIRIAAHKRSKPRLTRTKIADILSVGRAAITKHVDANSELSTLFEKVKRTRRRLSNNPKLLLNS